MPTKIELLQEAYKRGILPPDKLPLYEEAVKRGLLTAPEPTATPIAQEQTPSPVEEQQLPRSPMDMQKQLLGLGKVPLQGGLGRGSLDTVNNIAKGYPVAEVAMQAASGVPAAISGGLAGLGTIALQQGKEFFGGQDEPYDITLKRASDNVGKTQNAMTYQPQTPGGQQLSEAAQYPFKKYATGIEAVAEPIAEAGYPNVAASLATVAEAAPMAIGAKVLKPVNVKAKLADIAKNTKKKVVDTMDKAVKPQFKKQQTTKQIDAYHSKAVSVVEDIVKKKQKGQSFDVKGKPITDVPDNLINFREAIDEGFSPIHKKMDEFVKKTDAAGIRVDTLPVANAVNDIIKSKPMNDFSSATIAYAKKRKKVFKDRHKEGGYTAAEADEAMKMANAAEKAFYDNPTKFNYGKAMVEHNIANALRKEFTSTVEGYTGKGFKEQRALYGAYKELQSDVARAASKEIKKAGGFAPNFTDMISTYKMTEGITQLNASKLIAGSVMETMNIVRKLRRNPNRKVQKMFKTADKNLRKQEQIRRR